MYQPKQALGWWKDLGMRTMFRPMMVRNRDDPSPERALIVCVPCTTTVKGGPYEVPLPRVRWMPGSEDGVANVLGIEAVEHHRFERRAGRYDAPVITAVRKGIGWMCGIQ